MNYGWLLASDQLSLQDNVRVLRGYLYERDFGYGAYNTNCMPRVQDLFFWLLMEQRT